MWQLKLVFLLIGLVLAKIRKTDIHVFGTNNAHQTLLIHPLVQQDNVEKVVVGRTSVSMDDGKPPRSAFLRRTAHASIERIGNHLVGRYTTLALSGFLPMVEISEDHEVAPALDHRIYDYRDCKFRVGFNPSLCPNFTHRMYISFMHHMVVPARITKEMMERNGYVLERSEGDAPEESSNSTKLPDAEREFNYTIRVMKNGGVVMSKEESFSAFRTNFYVVIERGFVTLSTIAIRGKMFFERLLLELELDAPLPRYIMLFATHMQYCPSFISVVDSNFDVWKRGDRIDVSGTTIDKNKDFKVTTAFRDVFLSVLAIIAYYYCLTMFILPAYFNITMPLSSVRTERSLSRGSEEEDELRDDTKPSDEQRTAREGSDAKRLIAKGTKSQSTEKLESNLAEKT